MDFPLARVCRFHSAAFSALRAGSGLISHHSAVVLSTKTGGKRSLIALKIRLGALSPSPLVDKDEAWQAGSGLQAMGGHLSSVREKPVALLWSPELSAQLLQKSPADDFLFSESVLAGRSSLEGTQLLYNTPFKAFLLCFCFGSCSFNNRSLCRC